MPHRNLSIILFFCLMHSVWNILILPSHWKSTLKRYDKQSVFFEQDMILPRQLVVRAVENGTLTSSQRTNDKDGAVLETGTFRRWTNGIVPYVIDKNLKCSGRLQCLNHNPEKHIQMAIATWSKDTCIKFQKKTPADKDYLHFVDSRWGQCASHIGRIGGRQPVYLGLGCRSDGAIMHEIGHALGLFHEQNRPDRDAYVRINYNNIDRKYWINFENYTTPISNVGIPYDYASIMHYGPKAFVKTWKILLFAKSIEPVKKLRKGVKIGQRKRLSALDVKKVNLYYGCPQE